MKRLSLFGLLTLGVVSVFSCTKEKDAPVQDEELRPVTLRASEEGDTKVGFDKTGAFYWSTGDRIAVTTKASKTTFAELTLDEDCSGQATGTFTGTASSSPEGYAFYPFDRAESISGDNLTFTYASVYAVQKPDQTFFVTPQGTGNSFYAPMWGKIEDGSVTFRHLGGVLCLLVEQMPFAEGSVIVTSDQQMYGTYTVDLSEKEPTYSVGTDASRNTVTFDFTQAEVGKPGAFYLPLPVGNYTNVKVRVQNVDNSSYSETVIGDVTIKRRTLTAKSADGEDISAWDGVVINEIAAHGQTTGAASWVELLNGTESEMDISGIGLYFTDQSSENKSIYAAPDGTKLSAGQRLVISTGDGTLLAGIPSDADFTLKLARSASGKAIDEFSTSDAFGKVLAQTARGSYQRIPDGSVDWKNLTYSSEGMENSLFSLDNTLRNGIWVWSSHVAGLSENDYAKLKDLKVKGIDHIILNYAAFTAANKASTVAFISEAESLGLTVHAWIQCFHNSAGWINPIDDDNKCYKDEVFEEILANAKTYIEEYGVKGIHLDYIRFPGTAQSHNIDDNVNSVGAVTRCCSELRSLCDGYDEGLVISAAMMPDETAAGKYYGQNRTQMGQYLDIFMPMIYKYSYNYTDTKCQTIANNFSTYGAECWPGTTTYTGGDSSAVAMDAASVLEDCEVYKGTQAKGIVLFRYGIGEVPDLSDFTLN